MKIQSFKEVMGDIRIVFTKHAMERMATFGIGRQEAIKEIKSSIVRPDRKEYDKSTYKSEEGLVHFISGTHAYTIHKKIDKYNEESEIALVITVYDTQLFAKKKRFFIN